MSVLVVPKTQGNAAIRTDDSRPNYLTERMWKLAFFIVGNQTYKYYFMSFQHLNLGTIAIFVLIIDLSYLGTNLCNYGQSVFSIMGPHTPVLLSLYFFSRICYLGTLGFQYLY